MRPLLLAALSLSALVLLGCPDKGGPNTTDPPQVFLTILDTNALGDRLNLIVNQNGCKSVRLATIRHAGNVIKTFAFPSSPTAVDLLVADIPWPTVKLSAHLVLSAEVTCDDGRHNVSQEKGGQLFPVAEVHTLAGESVVPNIFYAEGAGDAVSFVGCYALPGGGTGLVRVDRNGAVLKTNPKPSVPCDGQTIFTEHAVNGYRWMYKPGVGAMAFDEDLNQTSLAQWKNPATGIVTLEVLRLTVGPDGDAMVTLNGDVNVGGEGGYDLWKIQHNPQPRCTNCDTVIWAVSQPGALGDAVVANGYVYQVVRSDASAGLDADVQTCRTPYNNNPAGTTPPECFPLFHLTRKTGDSFPEINAATQSDGAYSYATFKSGDGLNHFTVDASSTTTFNTDTWPANPVLYGTYGGILPFQKNQVIAAVGTNSLYFLNQATGAVLNPGGTPISPAGGLHALFVTSSGAGSDFYLESGGSSAVLPTEIVGVDAPGSGELFRFRVGDTSSLFLTLDDSGAPWMRVGTKLVRLYSLAQYRALLNGGAR